MRNSLAVRFGILTISILIVAIQPAIADDWQTITSGWEPNEMVASGNKIVASSVGGILIYNVDTGELNIFNKDNGLSSNTPVALAVDTEENCIWIGHEDASIDMFDLNTFRVKQTIKSLELDSDITTINDIDIEDGKIYVATDGGFSFLEKDEDFNDYFLRDSFQNFGEWRSPAEAFKVNAFNDKLFFALEQGIAVIDIKEDHREYNNFEFWTNFDYVTDLGYNSGDINATTLEEAEGILYLSVNQSPILKWETDTFIPALNYSSCYGFTSGPDGALYTGRYNGLYKQVESTTPGELDRFAQVDTNFTPRHWDVAALNDKVYAAIEFDSEYFGGLAVYEDDNVSTIHPNSPGGDEIQEMFYASDGTIWTSARNSSANGIYNLSNGSWIPYARPNVPMARMSRTVSMNTMGEDSYGGLWVGSWGNGIYYFPSEKDTVMMFDASNSPLVDVQNAEGNFVVISGFQSEENGGLWLTNQEAYDGRTLVYIPPSWFDDPVDERDNNSWLRFGGSQGMNSDFPGILVSDSYGRIWMGSISASPDFPLIILDLDGNSPEDAYLNPTLSDFTFLNSVATGFTTVNDMSIDENGVIWFATSTGLFHVDTNEEDVDNIEFEYISITEAESASSLMIDPLNQIWVGTNSGVFVLGKDRISWVRNYQFDSPGTKFPSPLVSNSILAMTFDPVSGKAYLGTDRGISVVKTPFRDFGEELGEISVSPQPFLLDDSGSKYLQFSSESLVAGAEVRLYTPSGKLIRELDFNTAGSSGWNGKDEDNKIVGSGVYIIVVTTPEGTSQLGKVAVVRK